MPPLHQHQFAHPHHPRMKLVHVADPPLPPPAWSSPHPPPHRVLRRPRRSASQTPTAAHSLVLPWLLWPLRLVRMQMIHPLHTFGAPAPTISGARPQPSLPPTAMACTAPPPLPHTLNQPHPLISGGPASSSLFPGRPRHVRAHRPWSARTARTRAATATNTCPTPTASAAATSAATFPSLRGRVFPRSPCRSRWCCPADPCPWTSRTSATRAGPALLLPMARPTTRLAMLPPPLAACHSLPVRCPGPYPLPRAVLLLPAMNTTRLCFLLVLCAHSPLLLALLYLFSSSSFLSLFFASIGARLACQVHSFL
eukprot:m.66920 g.66920  ORF g.66920 m.66920 type:complete len:311 (+) comp12674_c0_seq1:386-1318(+)